MAELTDDIRETVREKYAAAARAAADGSAGSSCCGPGSLTDADEAGVFGGALYGGGEGETVLDLGSGAGADVLISARRVGPGGRAIGLDMTDEMLALGRANAAAAGVG